MQIGTATDWKTVAIGDDTLKAPQFDGNPGPDLAAGPAVDRATLIACRALPPSA